MSVYMFVKDTAMWWNRIQCCFVITPRRQPVIKQDAGVGRTLPKLMGLPEYVVGILHAATWFHMTQTDVQNKRKTN